MAERRHAAWTLDRYTPRPLLELQRHLEHLNDAATGALETIMSQRPHAPEATGTVDRPAKVYADKRDAVLQQLRGINHDLARFLASDLERRALDWDRGSNPQCPTCGRRGRRGSRYCDRCQTALDPRHG